MGVAVPNIREGQLENRAEIEKCSIFQGFEGYFSYFSLSGTNIYHLTILTKKVIACNSSWLILICSIDFVRKSFIYLFRD